jgi:hypothetical protein
MWGRGDYIFGGVIYLKDSHVLRFRVGMGRVTNNLTKILALKLTLLLIAQKGATKLHR